MYSKYDRSRLDQAYKSLTETQREFLDHHVRRGKKSAWLNALAKHKGAHISEEDLEDVDTTMERLLDWSLADYIDHGERNPAIKCKCGIRLRHQYIALNTKTGDCVSFGVKHLQDHLAMPAHVVREVTKGLRVIDHERDEILTKIIDKWSPTFAYEPDQLTDDMKKHYEVGLPFLDRQADRLFRIVSKSKRRIEVSRFEEQAATVPFSSLYTVKPNKVTSLDFQVHSIPQFPPLDEDNLHAILTGMITVGTNSTALERLYDTVLLMKNGNFTASISLEEISDAAQAALIVADTQTYRRWLTEIISLCDQ